MKRSSPLVRRSLLHRSTPLPSGGPLTRSGLRRAPSERQRRMTKLRRDAYEVVDTRSGGRCESVGFLGTVRCVMRAEHHHHRRPRRAGGSTDPTTETAANLLHICAVHHRVTESYREKALLRGWLLHDGADPASVPVLMWQGLVLLREDGTTTPVEAT